MNMKISEDKITTFKFHFQHSMCYVSILQYVRKFKLLSGVEKHDIHIKSKSYKLERLGELVI